MSWSLGIDVGTTFTAAALDRGGDIEVMSLDSGHVITPTVLHAGADGDIACGTAAVERSATHPEGTAREFKRRLGDPVPIVLSGAPYSADRLVALFVRWVVDQASSEIGTTPDSLTITHPANWTEHQLHLLRSSLDLLGLADATFLSEPQAAAGDFGAVTRLADGALVLVYDLGGGTFDVALLRRSGAQFEHVGEPAGIERLGGIDFDEAVFQHVVRSLPADLVVAAQESREGRLALGRLRRACVEAKEALSSEVSVDIPVALGDLATSVRLTRREFEEMIRPMLTQTVDLVRHVMSGEGLTTADLSAVLLVGGSSRIPLVAELVGRELDVPVRVDAHPKLVVARGAARHAAATMPATRGAIAAVPTGPRRRRRIALIVGAVAAGVLAIGAVIGLVGGDSQPSAPTAADTTIAVGSTATPAPEASTPSTAVESTTSTDAEQAEREVIPIDVDGPFAQIAPPALLGADGVVTFPADGEGELRVSFTASTAGPYVVWARVRIPADASDPVNANSLFAVEGVNLSRSDEFVWDFWEGRAVSGPDEWEWDRISTRGSAGTHQSHENDPFAVRTRPGASVTFTLGGREPGVGLDTIYVTNDLTWAPPECYESVTCATRLPG